MADDAKGLAEAVLRDHDSGGDTLSRATVELALRIAGRHLATPPKRITWDVNDPPKPDYDKENWLDD
jgi:hypothetical protein